jgi:hypothetical protein
MPTIRPLVALVLLLSSARADEPIALGDRRELLVDDFLLEHLEGATLQLHAPEPREVVLVCDAPWEGNTSAYFTLFQDGDRFRAYYRGSHFDETTKRGTHPEFTCYAESRDGVRWEKPSLGLVPFAGSTANNIILSDPEASHNFAPFRDTNPAAPPEARYKALAGGKTPVNGKPRPCLHAYVSPDGIRWKRLQDEAVITAGAFDSQNLAFFDATRGVYRAYWRYFTAGSTDENGWKPKGVRAIRTAVSRDFRTWDDPVDLDYGDAPDEHLYTNAIRPYDRAPHLFLGFPTRFQPAHQQVEPVFMTSRDGVRFRRWPREIIPITAPEDRDGNRSNYLAHGLFQLPGQDRELSVYATEAYYTGPGSRLRRFAYRVDGFVSARAEATGSVLTKPFTFTGDALFVNLRSGGPTRFELQDAAGRPLPGFSLQDCAPLQLDEIETRVAWTGGSLAPHAGQAVRLRAALDRADWFAFRFGPSAPAP